MATAVSVAAVALPVASALPAVAVAASMVAVVAADVAVMTVAVAAEAVVVAVVLAAADSAVPSFPEPRSSPSRGPKSWLRESYLVRAPECRLRPSLRFRLRIPEPRYQPLDLAAVGLAPECIRAEAASLLSEGPGR